jgi:signal transduction histidine kinase
VAELLAGLSERISCKLSDLERGEPGALGELRELLAQQKAIHESIASRIESEVAARTRELDAFSHYLQTSSEREKALLARELHDSLGGILTPAKMDLAFLEARLGKDPEYIDRVHRLSALIDQGIDLKRRIIENLHPSLLDHLGLASALTWYVDEICRTGSVECRLNISEQLERLPSDKEIALYRLVQESVGNVVRHSKAKRLDLQVERTAKGLQLVVADDGVGIADLEHAKTLSHGLSAMMHRVRSMDGTMEIRSRPGEGTRIEVFVPL